MVYGHLEHANYKIRQNTKFVHIFVAKICSNFLVVQNLSIDTPDNLAHTSMPIRT